MSDIEPEGYPGARADRRWWWILFSMARSTAPAPASMPEHGGLAVGLGGATTILFVALPAILVAEIWILVSIYALVKWIGSAPEHANPTVIGVGIVGLITASLVLIAVAIGLVGRSMNPKKREKGAH